MIQLAMAPEPTQFDDTVRQRGLLALEILAGKNPDRRKRRDLPRKALKDVSKVADIPVSKLPTYWCDAIPDMMKVYKRVCAYSCVRINEVTGAKTVDHFVPKSKDRFLAYEWSNFRLSCARMNTKKGTISVLDPFGRIEGWFQLELTAFQVLAAETLPSIEKLTVNLTIEHLGLNDQDLLDLRASHAAGYWAGEYSFAHLAKESPFVALELERQGRK